MYVRLNMRPMITHWCNSDVGKLTLINEIFNDVCTHDDSMCHGARPVSSDSRKERSSSAKSWSSPVSSNSAHPHLRRPCVLHVSVRQNVHWQVSFPSIPWRAPPRLALLCQTRRAAVLSCPLASKYISPFLPFLCHGNLSYCTIIPPRLVLYSGEKPEEFRTGGQRRHPHSSIAARRSILTLGEDIDWRLTDGSNLWTQVEVIKSKTQHNSIVFRTTGEVRLFILPLRAVTTCWN